MLTQTDPPGAAARDEARPVLPPGLLPMLAQPADGPPDSPAYGYEVKWDGMRVLIGLDDERVAFRTRNGIDATRRFPELQSVREAIRPRRAILDGEVVRLVEGRPDFWPLQRRIQAADPRAIRALAVQEPCGLILFDLLAMGDVPVTARPWEQRRLALDEIVAPTPAVQVSPVWPDGVRLWDVVTSRGLEGIMAKLRAGVYTPGRRTAAWLKIKTTATVDLVVGGWTEGAGARQGSIGALLVGRPGGLGRLAYAGHVGTGFNRHALEDAFQRLAALETDRCPFEDPPPTNARPHWVRPVLVCEVRYQSWTDEGRLRAPVFLRWRPDKSPAECDDAWPGRRSPVPPSAPRRRPQPQSPVVPPGTTSSG
jgi:bifunctional non-homologous end joining protein LigD